MPPIRSANDAQMSVMFSLPDALQWAHGTPLSRLGALGSCLHDAPEGLQHAACGVQGDRRSCGTLRLIGLVRGVRGLSERSAPSRAPKPSAIAAAVARDLQPSNRASSMVVLAAAKAAMVLDLKVEAAAKGGA